MKSQTKAIIVSLLVLALALSAVSGVAYSWWSDSENVDIDIDAGGLDLDIGQGYVITETRMNGDTLIYEDKTVEYDRDGDNISFTISPPGSGNGEVSTYSISYTATFKTTVDAVYIIDPSMKLAPEQESKGWLTSFEIIVDPDLTPSKWMSLTPGEQGEVTVKYDVLIQMVVDVDKAVYAEAKLSIRNEIIQSAAVDSENTTADNDGDAEVTGSVQVPGVAEPVQVKVTFTGLDAGKEYSLDFQSTIPGELGFSSDQFGFSLSLRDADGNEVESGFSASIEFEVPENVVGDQIIHIADDGSWSVVSNATFSTESGKTTVSFSTDSFSSFVFFDGMISSGDMLKLITESFVLFNITNIPLTLAPGEYTNTNLDLSGLTIEGSVDKDGKLVSKFTAPIDIIFDGTTVKNVLFAEMVSPVLKSDPGDGDETLLFTTCEFNENVVLYRGLVQFDQCDFINNHKIILRDYGDKFIFDGVEYSESMLFLGTSVTLHQMLSTPTEVEKYIYVLANDISLVNNWTPIDNFTGILDGRGHKISNLKIDLEIGTDKAAGMFSTLEGTVKNLTIDEANVIAVSKGTSPHRATAVVAGYLPHSGLIENVTVSNSKVHGSHAVGGIAGHVEGTISGCTVSGSNLKCLPWFDSGGGNEGYWVDGEIAGGIAGYLSGNSENHGTISSSVVNAIELNGYCDIGCIAGAGDPSYIKENEIKGDNIITINWTWYHGYKDMNLGPVIGGHSQSVYEENTVSGTVGYKAIELWHDNTVFVQNVMAIPHSVIYVPYFGFEHEGKWYDLTYRFESYPGEDTPAEPYPFAEGVTLIGDCKEGEKIIFETQLPATLNNATFKNIILENATGHLQKGGIAYGNVLFEDCELKGSNWTQNYQGGDATITYKNCKISGWTSYGATLTKIEFENCAFNGNGILGIMRAYCDAVLTKCTFDYTKSTTEEPTGIESVGTKGRTPTVTLIDCKAVDEELEDIARGNKSDDAQENGKIVIQNSESST